MRNFGLFFILSITISSLILWSSCTQENLDELLEDNTGNTLCDTSFSVSYQNDIVWILRFTKNPSTSEPCYNCHSQATSGRGGGRVFDTYNGLKTYVDNEQLLCAIKHLGCAGAQPMPYLAGEKIPDCDINRIEAWINQGAPNN